MICPVCHWENFAGEDVCDHCGADLANADIPQAAIDYQDRILGEHLDHLGITAPVLVDPNLPVADAISQMHTSGDDCLLVMEDGRLIGVFTDRDAVVKAADKRLGMYKVRDFMTKDPVVLRHDETLAVAIHKMAVGEFRHIPILDDNKQPMGVVAAADIFRHLVTSLG